MHIYEYVYGTIYFLFLTIQTTPAARDRYCTCVLCLWGYCVCWACVSVILCFELLACLYVAILKFARAFVCVSLGQLNLC